ncbi:hypothetical protein ABEB36_001930 [Hypothenemus hampei]|uniref:Uncharacterized protein n=1 Tax=Hypothenemus hampei TaxID=57062 RepID=A0ABD1FG64_HYPHA
MSKDTKKIKDLQKYINHNHELYNSIVCKFRSPPQELEKEFKLLSFHSLKLFKDKLLEEHGDNYFQIVADGYKYPTQKWVYDLFKKEYGEPTRNEMISSLKTFINEYTTNCGENYAMEVEENLVIAQHITSWRKMFRCIFHLLPT